MRGYLLQRLLHALLVLLAASMLSFAVIELPQGDFLTSLRTSTQWVLITGLSFVTDWDEI